MIRVALRPKAAHPSQPKTPLTPRQRLLRVASWLALWGQGYSVVWYSTFSFMAKSRCQSCRSL